MTNNEFDRTAQPGSQTARTGSPTAPCKPRSMRSMSHDSAGPGGRRGGNLECSLCSVSPRWRERSCSRSSASVSCLRADQGPALDRRCRHRPRLPCAKASRLGSVPGTYVTEGPFRVQVTFTVPAGWGGAHRRPEWRVSGSGGRSAVTLAFSTFDIVYGDPCDFDKGPMNPLPGPSVDDLATALAGLPGLDVTTPTDITIDGSPVQAAHDDCTIGHRRLHVVTGMHSPHLGTATGWHVWHDSERGRPRVHPRRRRATPRDRRPTRGTGGLNDAGQGRGPGGS